VEEKIGFLLPTSDEIHPEVGTAKKGKGQLKRGFKIERQFPGEEIPSKLQHPRPGK